MRCVAHAKLTSFMEFAKLNGIFIFCIVWEMIVIPLLGVIGILKMYIRQKPSQKELL